MRRSLHGALIAEQQRCELIETPPPGLPLVRRVRRHVEGVLDAHLFQRLVIRLGGGGVLLAAVADEQHLDFLKAAGSLRARSSAAMLPPLKMPMCENLSRLARAICLVCAPPIDSAAMARCGWSASVR